MKLTGTTVFITGGAGGIGSAFARSLVQNGANVCIADTEGPKGENLAVELNKEFGLGAVKVIFIQCDVSDEADFNRAFVEAVRTFQHIDVMVNNAGVLNETSWEKMMSINLNGTIRGTYIALDHMRKDKGGKGGVIVNMSSLIGYQPNFAVPGYTASKHGIIGFTRSMATTPDIKDLGVRFACICPHTTDTPILNYKPHQVRKGYYDSIRDFKDMKNLSPYDVAEGLMSLIADDNSNDTILQITLEEGCARKRIMTEDC